MAEAASIYDPLSRAGGERLVADCSLLLDYLSRVPESRIDWCFDDTRGRAGGAPPARVAMPPDQTKTKSEFLEKLMGLASKVRDGGASGPLLDPKEVALLLTSRDFLSAIAWPATVESIRVTQAYCAERQRLRIRWWRRAFTRLQFWKRNTDNSPQEEDRAEFYGRRIARRRDMYQYGLVVLVALTVWLSYETLVGQRLVVEGQRFSEIWARHDEAVQKASQGAVTLIAGLHHFEPAREPQSGFQRYCDYVLRLPAGDADRLGSGTRLVASSGTRDGLERVPIAGEKAETREFFLNFEHQRLCDERLALHSRSASLEQWFRRWYGDVLPVVGLLRLPGDMYEDVHRGVCAARLWLAGEWSSTWADWESSARAARDDRAQEPRRPCVAGPPQRPISASRRADHVLPPTTPFYDWSVGTEVVTGGMLAQLLPCLYAMLGALASMFRRLSQRVEAEALSIADHGGMRMTLILGVLAGAVIGLFVGQVQTENSSSTLTLAGLALLAGYAVDRLFNLFDGLSIRIFGESTTAMPRSH